MTLAFGQQCSEWNLQLLFTVAQNSAEAAVRSNCIIALGDLAFRFPNVLEPWTEHMYARLNDKDPRVRKNSVLVLTHLILNDMVKVPSLTLQSRNMENVVSSMVAQ